MSDPQRVVAGKAREDMAKYPIIPVYFANAATAGEICALLQPGQAHVAPGKANTILVKDKDGDVYEAPYKSSTLPQKRVSEIKNDAMQRLLVHVINREYPRLINVGSKELGRNLPVNLSRVGDMFPCKQFQVVCTTDRRTTEEGQSDIFDLCALVKISGTVYTLYWCKTVVNVNVQHSGDVQIPEGTFVQMLNFANLDDVEAVYIFVGGYGNNFLNTYTHRSPQIVLHINGVSMNVVVPHLEALGNNTAAVLAVWKDGEIHVIPPACRADCSVPTRDTAEDTPFARLVEDADRIMATGQQQMVVDLTNAPVVWSREVEPTADTKTLSLAERIERNKAAAKFAANAAKGKGKGKGKGPARPEVPPGLIVMYPGSEAYVDRIAALMPEGTQVLYAAAGLSDTPFPDDTMVIPSTGNIIGPVALQMQCTGHAALKAAIDANVPVVIIGGAATVLPEMGSKLNVPFVLVGEDTTLANATAGPASLVVRAVDDGYICVRDPLGTAPGERVSPEAVRGYLNGSHPWPHQTPAKCPHIYFNGKMVEFIKIAKMVAGIPFEQFTPKFFEQVKNLLWIASVTYTEAEIRAMANQMTQALGEVSRIEVLRRLNTAASAQVEAARQARSDAPKDVLTELHEMRGTIKDRRKARKKIEDAVNEVLAPFLVALQQAGVNGATSLAEAEQNQKKSKSLAHVARNAARSQNASTAATMSDEEFMEWVERMGVLLCRINGMHLENENTPAAGEDAMDIVDSQDLSIVLSNGRQFYVVFLVPSLAAIRHPAVEWKDISAKNKDVNTARVRMAKSLGLPGENLKDEAISWRVLDRMRDVLRSFVAHNARLGAAADSEVVGQVRALLGLVLAQCASRATPLCPAYLVTVNGLIKAIKVDIKHFDVLADIVNAAEYACWPVGYIRANAARALVKGLMDALGVHAVLEMLRDAAKKANVYKPPKATGWSREAWVEMLALLDAAIAVKVEDGKRINLSAHDPTIVERARALQAKMRNQPDIPIGFSVWVMLACLANNNRRPHNDRRDGESDRFYRCHKRTVPRWPTKKGLEYIKYCILKFVLGDQTPQPPTALAVAAVPTCPAEAALAYAPAGPEKVEAMAILKLVKSREFALEDAFGDDAPALVPKVKELMAAIGIDPAQATEVVRGIVLLECVEWRSGLQDTDDRLAGLLDRYITGGSNVAGPSAPSA